MKTLLQILPIVLLAIGAVIIWISFSSEENITGMWVAGKDFRDKEFKEGERFHKRIYTILKIVGILLFLSGCLIAILVK
jgi:hypothetical protein